PAATATAALPLPVRWPGRGPQATTGHIDSSAIVRMRKLPAAQCGAGRRTLWPEREKWTWISKSSIVSDKLPVVSFPASRRPGVDSRGGSRPRAFVSCLRVVLRAVAARFLRHNRQTGRSPPGVQRLPQRARLAAPPRCGDSFHESWCRLLARAESRASDL